MSCLDCHDYMDGYNQGKREGVIEGLKLNLQKVKDICKNNDDLCITCPFVIKENRTCIFRDVPETWLIDKMKG